MRTADFDYHLPTSSIAQSPAKPRDSSQLMIVDRQNKTTTKKVFRDVVDYFQAGDLLVWNNTKVFKARLLGHLVSSTGEILFDHKKPVEIFLIREMENEGVWKVLGKPGKHILPGSRVVFAKEFHCDIIVKESDGTLLVQFPYNAEKVRELANIYGNVPLPPYVKDEKHELETYQTVYANDTKEGSVAAPTAGFHFTPELIAKLKNKGVELAEVTLHVGLGTFLPVKTERIEDHTMHSEWVELSEETATKINLAKVENRRVIAVGTTTVRTLEGISKFKEQRAKNKEQEWVGAYHGDLNLFITPGFEFQVVDALITNFHLPKSTLLMLVCAFAKDTDFMLKCYEQAVVDNFRFFSFGDAMLIV